MKKSGIFILILLLIVIAEMYALYKCVQNPPITEYEIATAEYKLPRADIPVIRPFVFESGWRDEINNYINEIKSVIVPQKQDLSAPETMQYKPETEEPEGNAAEVDNSAQLPDKNKALIAVVIDDVGLSLPFTNQIAQIKKPITVAFLPYGAADKRQVLMLKNAGFEVMLHTPMMPHVPASLAPNTLSPEMSRQEIQSGFKSMLKRFAGTGMVGANNHMGSLFTEDRDAMSAVIELLAKENMFFLDSKTSAKSVAKQVCQKYNVPYIARDVFLDNEKKYEAIMKQFMRAEEIAKKHGFAVAIGHPYKQTLAALKDWEAQNDAHGVEIVPLSYLVRKGS